MEKKSTDNPTSKAPARAPAKAPTKSTSDASRQPSSAPIIESGDTVTTGVTADEPVTVVMKPPKKSRRGLIAAIIILVLLIAGGGALAFWYFAIYSNPDKVALDAMQQFLSAENIITDGTVELYSAHSGDSTVVVSLDFSSSSMRVPASGKVSLSISERDSEQRVIDDHIVEVDIGTTIMTNGDIYFQISNATQALDKALKSSDDLLETYGEVGAMVYEIVEAIDNEWWQVSPADVADTLGLESSDTEPALSFYDCTLSIIESDHSQELVDLYNKDHFIRVARTDRSASASGRGVYEVTFDYLALTDFINALPDTSAASEFYTCYDDFARAVNRGSYDKLSARDFDELDPEDVKDALNDWQIYLEISDFGHKLHGLEAAYQHGRYKLEADLGFQYELAEIAPPENYRPITDLIDDISDIISDRLYGNIIDDSNDSDDPVGGKVEIKS